DLDVVQRQLADAREALSLAEQNCENAASAVDAARSTREALESAWVEGQAATLARSLSEGQACPVCGSTEHPRLARSRQAVPSEQTLQAQKQRVDDLRQTLESAREAEGRAESQVKGLEASVTRLEAKLGEDAHIALDEIQARADEMADESKAASEAAARFHVLDANATALDAELRDARDVLARAEARQQAAASEHARAQAIVDERKTAIPESLRTIGVLEIGRASGRERWEICA